MADLYLKFFGFVERPFTLLPDPDFLFWSDQHRRAYSVLEYGIATRAPLTIVTGEIGAGKTTLIQKMLSELDEEITIGLISNAQGGRGDLLRWVLSSLEIPTDPHEDYITLFRRFETFVINEYAAGRHVVLVIDEAQSLSVEALEELRMFTNINSNKDELLQLILVGQPELRELISSPVLEQFAQRVTAFYHLRPLNRRETEAYIHHRLTRVGGTGLEFSPEAIDRVYREAGGIPRLTNKLCDMALVYAASVEKRSVDSAILGELIADGLFINSRKPDVYVLNNPIMVPHRKVAE